MSIDWPSILVQVPLLAVFIWFVLQRDRMYQEAESKRDAEWRSFIEKRDLETSRWIESLAQVIESLRQTLEKEYRDDRRFGGRHTAGDTD